MSRTKQELLASFKKANKEARERKALIAGFKNANEYLKYLTEPTTVNKTVTKTNKTTSKKEANINMPTIHIVDVLDVSYSMVGEKIRAANKGINLGFEALLKDNKINYKYTLCTFSTSPKIEYVNSILNEVKTPFRFSVKNNTALYDAIGQTINDLKPFVNKNEKVLVNIYTDGEENCSTKYNKSSISEKMEEMKKQGWTFTFIGTDKDVKQVIKDLKIDSTNTKAYNGTGKELEVSLQSTITARSIYASKVLKNEDVSIGFYKDIK